MSQPVPTMHFLFSVSFCALLILTACSQTHQADVDGGASLPRIDGGQRVDAGPQPSGDAGSLDAAISIPDSGTTVDAGNCAEPRRPNLVCDTRNGGSGDFSLLLTGCYCGERVACDGRVIGNRVNLNVTLDSCVEELCDGCFDLEAACRLDADLGPDSYDVYINDDYAFRTANLIDPTITPRCYVPAPVPPTDYECEAPRRIRSDELRDTCIPDEVGPDRGFWVSAAAEIGGCFTVAGGCELSMDSDGIRIDPMLRECRCSSCGDCPPIASVVSVGCELPRIEPGLELPIRIHGDETIVRTGAEDNLLCSPFE